MNGDDDGDVYVDVHAKKNPEPEWSGMGRERGIGIHFLMVRNIYIYMCVYLLYFTATTQHDTNTKQQNAKRHEETECGERIWVWLWLWLAMARTGELCAQEGFTSLITPEGKRFIKSPP